MSFLEDSDPPGATGHEPSRDGSGSTEPVGRPADSPGSAPESERLARRTQELNLIQALGRRAAGAHDLDGLFAATLSTLSNEIPLELALTAHALPGAPECVVHAARPFSADRIAELAARAARMLQWPVTPAARFEALECYDATLAERDRMSEEDLVALPLERRGQVAGCLLVVLPAREGRAATERLLFSAANQLSLHIDRILAAREDEARRFRTIFDSMPQAVLLTDGAWRVRQFNRTAELLFGGLDLPLENGLAAARELLELDALVERVRAGRTNVAEGETHPGRDRVLAVTVSPIAAEGREKDGLVVVVTDVTERRRLQDQLAQAETMSSLGLMISGVAHELNNPLTSILGYAQLLGTAGGDAEKRARRVELLNRETQRCQRIVQNLLSFARRRSAVRERLSLNEVVHSVLALMGYQLRVHDIEVQTELDDALPPITADRHQLQQVLVNLISNAQHAIQGHGRGGRIAVRTSAGPPVRLEVEDDGPGIDPALRERIFEPFYTTKEEGRGTGLGLSLVHGIVAAHGGTIDARSAPGRGALFRIELSPGKTPTVAEPPAQEVERDDPSPRSGRILVVDDEHTLARMVAEALGEDGHVVSTAPDGERALEALARDEFDLIIADVKMPTMDGERLYDELRRRHPELARRLVLTSGDTVGDDAEDTARRTGLELLSKPFDLERLRKLVGARLEDVAGS